jgi:polysaccharide biosynthesis transport protein
MTAGRLTGDGTPQRPHVRDRDATLVSIVQCLLRGWRWCLLAGLAGGLAGYLAAMLSSPSFTASAQIMLETRERNVGGSQEVVPGLRLDDRAIASEVAVLRSRDLISESVATYRRDAQEAPHWPFDSPKDQGAAVDVVLRELRVGQVGISAVIGLSFTASDPVRAADFLNVLVDMYVARQVDLRRSEIREAALFLDDRVRELQVEMRQAESAVAAQREALAEVGSSSLVALEARAEATALEASAAQARRVEVEARVEGLESSVMDGIGAGADMTRNISRALDPAVAARLEGAVEEAQREVEALAASVGPNHPSLRAANSALAASKEALADAIRDRLADLRADLADARTREGLLAEAARHEQSQIAAVRRARIALEETEAEASIARDLYGTMALRLSEVRAQEAMARADARVIARAEPPRSPTSPRPALATAAGSLAALLAAAAAVLLAEGVRRPYRRAEDVVEDLGAPLAARIPRRRRTSPRLIAEGLTTHATRVDPAAMEGFRALDAALRTHGGRTVAVVSGARGEGKTSTCLGIASAAFEAGMRVRMIDADLRNPALSRAFGMHDDISGFSDALLGGTSGETVQPIVPGLDLVPAGRLLRGAIVRLRDRAACSAAVQSLAEGVDITFIDTPAAMAFTDAALIAGTADIVLFLVAEGRVPREDVATAARRLVDLGAPPTLVAMTFSTGRVTQYSSRYPVRQLRLRVVGGSGEAA